MFSLDMRTAIFSYVLISIISTIVVTFLLKQYRSRYRGVHYMLFCFALQTVALIMILLRGLIPDWISFDISNTISIAGIILFYIGLEAYTGQRSSVIPNLILLIVFAVIHSWFTFGKPDLAARHLNVAIVWLIIFSQCTWLLLIRIPRAMARLTRPVNLVCLAFCVVCILRIIKFISAGHKSEDYFNSDLFDTAIILISQVLLILLIFSLEHMFANQLLEDIKAEEEKFSKAFQTSPYGIALTRLSDGKIIEINNEVSKITGYSNDEVYGKTTIDFNFWYDADVRAQIIEELKDFGKVNGKEIRFRKKNGEPFPAMFSSEIITINNEKCMLSNFEDITERKKQVEELIKSKEKAEESDRLKTAFLHNISHEIRTPMNAIVGFSSLLAEPDITEETRQSYTDIITLSSTHLLKIVNDIIEISNLEAGILKLNYSDFNLNSLLSDIYRMHEPKSVKQGIGFNIITGLPDSDSTIRTDKTKLFQIISNLLSNAFKFTDKGRIVIGYKLNNDYLEFHVTDTGIGIPFESQDKIFERFYQVRYSASRPYDGTGLGLSILKSYLNLLGGKVWLESEPEKGSSFFFTLPYIKPDNVGL